MATIERLTIERRFTWTAPGLWAMVSLHACALLAFLPAARPSAGTIVLMAATLAIRNFAISAGFHRYFSHRSYQTSRWMQFLLAFIGGMGVMRSALWWASQHREHHRSADTEKDPHSPHEGFFWSHLLWFMARRNQATRHELIPDLEKYPELVWLDRFEWVPLLVLMAVCFAIDGFPGWVWGATVSSVLLCHFTFSINSFSHVFGSRRYEISDDSRNNLVVALVSFGEGWHNNHHHHPARARIGERAWEVDISWYGLWLLGRFGLVWDLRR